MEPEANAAEELPTTTTCGNVMDADHLAWREKSDTCYRRQSALAQSIEFNKGYAGRTAHNIVADAEIFDAFLRGDA